MLQVIKIVEFTKEVEIPITTEDISQCLMTSPLEDRKEAAIIMVSDCLKVLKGIPDTVIAELHPEFCKTVTHLLAEEMRRFSDRGEVLILEQSDCLDSSCTVENKNICQSCIKRNVVAKRGFDLIQLIEKLPASVDQTTAVTAASEFVKLAEDIFLAKGVQQ